MFRLDIEDKSPIDDKLADRLLAVVKRQLRGAAALCIEDYNKGVLTPRLCDKLIKAARQAGVPSLVDPAAIEDYSKYSGATCITPNRTEAELAGGIIAAPGNETVLAKKLLRQHRFGAVVLTLDRHGAVLLEKGRKSQHVPTVARSVYDVTGAGDMVLAMLAAAIANGADLYNAVRLANIAAGLEVERFGVVPIALDEIIIAVVANQHGSGGKLRNLEHLLPELRAWRNLGKSIAFTNGCFDILHAGHVNYLREARKCADLLVVAINSDASVKRLKGADRPYNNQRDRAAVLAELQSVDYLMVFSADTPTALIKAIKPDVLVKGGDYKPSQVVGASLVKNWGGKVKVVSLTQGKSTTNLVNHIRSEQEE